MDTNREDALGNPQSADCVLMANSEIVELFEPVRVGDGVWIEEWQEFEEVRENLSEILAQLRKMMP